MKKWLQIIACTLFACMMTAGSALAKDKIVVGFSQIGAESAWRVANTDSIVSEAKSRPNIELKFLMRNRSRRTRSRPFAVLFHRESMSLPFPR